MMLHVKVLKELRRMVRVTTQACDLGEDVEERKCRCFVE